MQRLSLLDALFLDLEDAEAPMHIAGICIFEGPAPGREELRQRLSDRLDQIPRYRQRVRSLPFELGRPVWVDDPHFDLDYHLKFTAVPSPGDDRVLRDLVGRVMSPTLDRTRPLWETWCVEGLAEGRWALISKTHHSMVDGVSGTELLGAVLDATDGSQPVPSSVTWHAESEPLGRSLVEDAWRGLAGDAARWGGKLWGGIREPAMLGRAARDTGQGLIRWARNLSATPPLSIEGSVGRRRVYGFHVAPLSSLSHIRQVHGGTLNDVVLAAITGGYRRYLLQRGDVLEGVQLRTLIPVSVRRADEHNRLDNRVSALLCELPIAEPRAAERLRILRTHMATHKASHMAEVGDWLLDVGNLAPPMLVGPLTRLIARIMHRRPQRALNTVTTNVPGPRFPLYLLGRLQERWLPYVPIYQGLRTGIAILSYNGQMAFGVTGDYDSTPDVQVLADAIGQELKELATSENVAMLQ